MSFSEYATPVATLKYSPQYFAALTFLRVQELDYPEIATSSIVKSWFFTNDIPSTAVGTVIQPGELIPFIEDVLPISRAMAAAFAAAVPYLNQLQIRLFIAINNHFRAIAAARQLYLHIVATTLLSRVDIQFFGELRIFDSISGFDITRFPLWKLSCLLGETWLEEDVLNALLELHICPVKILGAIAIICTSFVAGYVPFPLPKFRLLFAALIITPGTTTPHSHLEILFMGTLWGGPAASDIMPSFSWFLQHTGHSAPLRVTSNGIRELQGPQSGSCGVAVLNFIQCRSSASKTFSWTDEASPHFRNKAIQDLVVYHFIASIHKSPRDSWTVPCAIAPATAEETNTIDDGPVGFNDFNLSRPTAEHPIQLFEALGDRQPSVLIPGRPYVPEVHLPTNPLSKLPGLAPTPSLIVLDSDEDSDTDDHDFEVTQLKKITSFKLEPAIIDLSRDSDSPSPFPSRRLLHPTVFLRDPSEESDDVVVVSHTSAPSKSITSPKKEPLCDITNSQQRQPFQVIGDINIGKTYRTFEEGKADVYALENARGNIWRIAQSLKPRGGSEAVKYTVRCNRYYHHIPKHDPTIKTNCMAHVNFRRSAKDGTWHVTFTDWQHNHPPTLSVGASIPRPATEPQRELVAKLATSSTSNFSRSQISKVLNEHERVFSR
ncbi:hypothetical protein R3P38DRAFT_2770949 [Favolaschia claudopus]|uniref:WRKY domain-containing protein n=1 Tax=Favolaschia claudopus TaxID=2862362 RepID=A0AAW0CG41_9AGAR